MTCVSMSYKYGANAWPKQLMIVMQHCKILLIPPLAHPFAPHYRIEGKIWVAATMINVTMGLLLTNWIETNGGRVIIDCSSSGMLLDLIRNNNESAIQVGTHRSFVYVRHTVVLWKEGPQSQARQHKDDRGGTEESAYTFDCWVVVLDLTTKWIFFQFDWNGVKKCVLRVGKFDDGSPSFSMSSQNHLGCLSVYLFFLSLYYEFFLPSSVRGFFGLSNAKNSHLLISLYQLCGCYLSPNTRKTIWSNRTDLVLAEWVYLATLLFWSSHTHFFSPLLLSNGR